MSEERKAVNVRIDGVVQGVSYRVWTQREAERLGVSGWVRNERDGSVTALLVGPDEAVSTMLKRLWHGPPGASVTAVDVQIVAELDTPVGFKIT